MNDKQKNDSVIGRLLEELSWVGSTIRNYREGGRGYENILTAEALLGLDFLPRHAFLGSVISNAHGADAARSLLVSEIEDARVTLLPGNFYLKPSGDRDRTRLSVQPDGLVESSNTFTVLEAKRIRRSSFQTEQLAREYVLTLRDAGVRKPVYMLILGSPPPVHVARMGKMEIPEAISNHLPRVLEKAEGHQLEVTQAIDRIDDCVCWITWQEISDVVASQQKLFKCEDPSVRAAIDRLATSVTRAIAWHS